MSTLQAPVDCRTELDPSLQLLVETRLDILDRILVGRVSRGDRMSILGEVESQIEELVAQKDAATLSRADLLEILGRIDPPEAYIPDDLDERESRMTRRRYVAMPLVRVRPAEAPAARPSRTGMIGGILGSASLVMLLLLGALALGAGMLLESEPVFFIGLFLASVVGITGGVAALILGIVGRHQGALAIIGIVSGTLSFLASLCLPVLAILIIN